VPSVLADERACNPFLRVDSDRIVAALGHPRDRVGRFAELRRLKDDYGSAAA
jgi:hydroxyacylglutathione hydrolase